VLGSLYPYGSKVVKFEVTDVKPRFSYHVVFQIHMDYSKYMLALGHVLREKVKIKE
jgi:hypothetical protein